MTNITSTSQLFIPFSHHAENFTSNNCENNSHLRNINNVTVFDGNRIKRRKRDVECNGQSQCSVPWQRRDQYSPGVVGFHEEVSDFYDTMSPVREEKEVRLKVVTHIQQTVISLWPEAKVDVFGSFNTGLYLPTSDIDIVVTGKWESLPLLTLKTALVKSGIDDGDISILSQAVVPIVRLVHTQTKVKVDISFNVPNGVKSAELIKNSIKMYPVLPKLVLVLKQFLLHRSLNEVYYGGLSSYAVTLLVISFLQGHHKPKSLPVTNLGTLLLEFFELYGKHFNYEKVCISVRNGGFYYRKQNPWDSYLSIEDPLCEGNDITKGTYLMREIQNAFENAYNTLHKALTEPDVQKRPQSILQLVLDVDTNVLIQRQWIIDNFDEIASCFSSDHERDSSTQDWKENIAKPFVPSTDIKESVVNSEGRKETQKEISTRDEDTRIPLQKTLVFYGSGHPTKDTRDRSCNFVNSSNRMQHVARNNFNSSENRMGPNSQQQHIAKKSFKNSKRNFKRVTNNQQK